MELMTKILNLKLVILLEHQNIKIICAKGYVKYKYIAKYISNLKSEEIIETF